MAEVLQLSSELKCCDSTLGGGGHSCIIAAGIEPGGTLVVFDEDPAAFEEALPKLTKFEVKVIPVHSNFRHIGEVLKSLEIETVDRIFADLGLSSRQLDNELRGFSFSKDGPLDMRQNPSKGITASEYLASVTERELVQILQDFGDERWAARIARFIIEGRTKGPITRTRQLADLVSQAIPRAAWPKDKHPATRTFQAIRVKILDEIPALQEFLESALKVLAPNGIMAVMSFQGDEDQIVKSFMNHHIGKCTCPPRMPVCVCGAKAEIKILTRKPITPSDDECRLNPRARSARLRAFQKL